MQNKLMQKRFLSAIWKLSFDAILPADLLRLCKIAFRCCGRGKFALAAAIMNTTAPTAEIWRQVME